MGPNMFVHHMAIEADRKTLEARAERGWRVEQAAAARQRSMPQAAARRIPAVLAVRARWSVGAVLIRTGARLQAASGLAVARSAAVA